MSLSSLTANPALAYDGRHYRRDRRALPDMTGEAEARSDGRPGDRSAAGGAPSGSPHDAAYYASRFKANLSDLEILAEEHDHVSSPQTWDVAGDGELYDFFGNLSVLLVSVRAGDLERARAAADALQMELMVERSAGGHSAEPRRPNMLGDLGRLLSAARSGDEGAARAAAKELARDVKIALDPPHPPAEETVAAALPPAAAIADPEAAGAAYDTLMSYSDGELDSAA